MNYEIILLLISSLAFISYTVFLFLKYPGIKSYSYSYYVIRRNEFFTFFTWGYALPLLMLTGKLLFFLAGAAIIFVGVAGDYLSETDRSVFWIHMIGSYGGVLLGIAGLWVHLGLWWVTLPALIIIVLMNFSKMKTKIFWIEFFTMLLILITFFILFV